jgi:hypothetical protein
MITPESESDFPPPRFFSFFQDAKIIQQSLIILQSSNDLHVPQDAANVSRLDGGRTLLQCERHKPGAALLRLGPKWMHQQDDRGSSRRCKGRTVLPQDLLVGR